MEEAKEKKEKVEVEFFGIDFIKKDVTWLGLFTSRTSYNNP